MLDWIKLGNKNYPEFWKKYLSTFDQKSSRIVILKIDTSGTDAKKDVILSIAAIAVDKNSLSVGDSFEAIISDEISRRLRLTKSPARTA